MLNELAAKLRRRLTLSHLVPYMAGEFRRQQRRLDELERRVRLMQEALGRIESRQVTAAAAPHELHAAEFRAFSQWGEDGIIDHLVRHVPIRRELFVEFGVENYEEANTRFLLVNRNWSGVVIDGSADNIAQVRKSRVHWLHDLTAVAAFVTRENINQLLSDAGATGDIGLLSIDVDGVDWWIWDAIEVARPAIVVIEHNYRFGAEPAVTVPYDPAFDRRAAHHSILYYGASLAALERLGRRKGYDLVGVGGAALNAFFVRADLRPAAIPRLTAADTHRAGKFCEAHDAAGERVKMSNDEQARLVMGLPLVRIGDDGRPVEAPA